MRVARLGAPEDFLLARPVDLLGLRAPWDPGLAAGILGCMKGSEISIEQQHWSDT